MRKLAGALLASAWLSGAVCGGEVTVAAVSGIAGRPEAVASAEALLRGFPGAVKVAFGNLCRGRAAATAGGGLPVIAELNRCGWEAIVPGAADLRLPAEFLQRWRREFRGAVMGARWVSGDFRPAAILVVERGGVRIGIVALGDPGARQSAQRRREVICRDETEAVRDALNELKRAGCRARILLCSLPVSDYGALEGVLAAAPEIDAVISAYGRGSVPGRMVRNRLCIQPGRRGAAVLKLHFGADGGFRFAEGALIGEDDSEGKPADRGWPGRAAGSEKDVLPGEFE